MSALLYDFVAPATQRRPGSLWAYANNAYKATMGEIFRGVAVDTFGWLQQPVSSFLDPLGDVAFCRYLFTSSGRGDVGLAGKPYVNDLSGQCYQALKHVFLPTYYQAFATQATRADLMGFIERDGVLLNTYQQRFGKVQAQTAEFRFSCDSGELEMGFYPRPTLIDSNKNAHVTTDQMASVLTQQASAWRDADLDQEKQLLTQLWQHSWQLRFMYFWCYPDASQQVELDAQQFQLMMSGLAVLASFSAYIQTKSYQNKHFNLYIRRGEGNPLFWLYFFNPLKYIEFGVRLLESLVLRFWQMGAETHSSLGVFDDIDGFDKGEIITRVGNEKLLKQVGWLRWFLQLNTALVFSVPKFMVGMVASPLATMDSMSYYFSSFKNAEGETRLLAYLMGWVLYSLVWSAFVTQIFFLWQTLVPAWQAGVSLMSPAMLNLVFGGASTSVILSSLLHNGGVYLIPYFTLLRGYDFSRPFDARLSIIRDTVEDQLRAEQADTFGINCSQHDEATLLAVKQQLGHPFSNVLFFKPGRANEKEVDLRSLALQSGSEGADMIGSSQYSY